jgi:hypothetical protein
MIKISYIIPVIILSFQVLHQLNAKTILDLKVKDGKITDATGNCTVIPRQLGKPGIVPVKNSNDIYFRLNSDHSLIIIKGLDIEKLSRTRQFKIDALIKPDTLLGEQHVIHKLVSWSNSGYASGAFSMGFTDEKPFASIYTLEKKRTFTAIVGKKALKSNEWMHMIFSSDGKTIKFTVNGNLIEEKTIPPGIFPQSPKAAGLLIGNGCFTGRAPFLGAIRHIKITDNTEE